MHHLQYVLLFCLIHSLIFLNADITPPPSLPPLPPESHLSQMEIHAIGWNDEYWLIGGNSLEVFQDGDFVPHPLLVKYSNSIFTDLSSQFQVGNRIIEKIVWNGEYWLIAYRFHEYGGIVKYDGQKFYNIPLPGHPLSLWVRALDWNGKYWLMGSGYIGHGYLLEYDGTTITDLISLSGLSTVDSITWMNDCWLLGGKGSSGGEKLMSYDGYTFFEIEKPEFVGIIMNATWNGEYLLFYSNEKLIKYDGEIFEDIASIGRLTPAIAWNGWYWLIGGEEGMLQEYDGNVFTDLESEAGFSGYIQAIGWNGNYWIIGDTVGDLRKYNGEAFTDLSLQLHSALQFLAESPSESESSLEQNDCYVAVVGIGVMVFMVAFLSYLLRKRKKS
jgi:hypothetical protein